MVWNNRKYYIKTKSRGFGISIKRRRHFYTAIYNTREGRRIEKLILYHLSSVKLVAVTIAGRVRPIRRWCIERHCTRRLIINRQPSCEIKCIWLGAWKCWHQYRLNDYREVMRADEMRYLVDNTMIKLVFYLKRITGRASDQRNGIYSVLMNELSIADCC